MSDHNQLVEHGATHTTAEQLKKCGFTIGYCKLVGHIDTGLAGAATEDDADESGGVPRDSGNASGALGHSAVLGQVMGHVS